MQVVAVKYSPFLPIKGVIRLNLSKLSDEELRELRDDITREIRRRKAANEREARHRKALEIAEQSGIDPEEIRSARLYRNPWNQWQTWNGLGRRPKWIKEYEAQGGDIDDLLC